MVNTKIFWTKMKRTPIRRLRPPAHSRDRRYRERTRQTYAPINENECPASSKPLPNEIQQPSSSYPPPSPTHSTYSSSSAENPIPKPFKHKKPQPSSSNPYADELS